MKKILFLACLLSGCATTQTWEPDGDIHCQDLGLKKGSKEHIACALQYDQMLAQKNVALRIARDQANTNAINAQIERANHQPQAYPFVQQPITTNNHMTCTSNTVNGYTYTNCN